MPILSAIPCSSSFDILWPGGSCRLHITSAKHLLYPVSEIVAFEEDFVDLFIRRTLFLTIGCKNGSNKGHQRNWREESKQSFLHTIFVSPFPRFSEGKANIVIQLLSWTLQCCATRHSEYILSFTSELIRSQARAELVSFSKTTPTKLPNRLILRILHLDPRRKISTQLAHTWCRTPTNLSNLLCATQAVLLSFNDFLQSSKAHSACSTTWNPRLPVYFSILQPVHRTRNFHELSTFMI